MKMLVNFCIRGLDGLRMGISKKVCVARLRKGEKNAVSRFRTGVMKISIEDRDPTYRWNLRLERLSVIEEKLMRPVLVKFPYKGEAYLLQGRTRPLCMESICLRENCRTDTDHLTSIKLIY